MTNVNLFGFSTEPSQGGDFTPIVKYDSRAGRFFRIDRIQDSNGYTNDQIDITNHFRAVADFENVEVGWINFPQGGAPSFVLVPMGTQLPPRPSDQHKNGLRFMMKLDAACGGEKRVREVASSAKAFLGGVEQIYGEYLRQKESNPGKLPVLSLTSTMPVTTGSGQKQSTNYRPNFRIEGWIDRPHDLVHTPKQGAAPVASMTPANGNYPPPVPDFVEYREGYKPPAPISRQDKSTAPWEDFPESAPKTGGQVVSQPPAPNPQAAKQPVSLESDFG
jgi:hypothetical protein